MICRIIDAAGLAAATLRSGGCRLWRARRAHSLTSYFALGLRFGDLGRWFRGNWSPPKAKKDVMVRGAMLTTMNTGQRERQEG